MKEKLNLRPAAAAFLLMMAMAITTTALSFFVTPVCEELGIGRGSFSLYYSLMTAAGALSNTFLGRFIGKRGVRPIMLVSSIWVFCGLSLFSMANSLWIFYVTAAAMGLFATSCVSLCANIIVQQSYSSAQASGIMGFVMAGSGVGGMILSLIVPNVLGAVGWRMGYRFLGMGWMVLVLSGFLLLGKQKEAAAQKGQIKLNLEGMSRAEAVRSPKLYLLMASIFVLAACCGIQQQMPALLSGKGFSTEQVSVMISLLTTALALGKIVQGILSSKIGVVRGVYAMIGMFIAGFLLLMFRFTVYPALVCLAFGMGTVTTLLPIITRFVFGPREYASIWSMLATASSVGSFLAAPLWGLVYDVSGSYTPALLLGAVLMTGILVILMRVFGKR